MDYKTALLDAEEKGMKKGMEKGTEKGERSGSLTTAKQIVRSLRLKHFDEQLIVNIIQDTLGKRLSKEDIENILKDE